MWSRAEKIAVIGVVVTILGVLATIMFPEFRRFLGLSLEQTLPYRPGGSPPEEKKQTAGEVLPPNEEPKNPDYGQKKIPLPEIPESATSSRQPIIPPGNTKIIPPNPESKIVPPDSWRKTMTEMLTDLSRSSAVPIDTTLVGYLRERHVQVLFTEPQLQVAAQIVHRLRALGAIVDYKLVPNDKTMGNPHVLYHWNYLQAAQAIQAALQGIQPLELERDDSSRVISVWIS